MENHKRKTLESPLSVPSASTTKARVHEEEEEKEEGKVSGEELGDCAINPFAWLSVELVLYTFSFVGLREVPALCLTCHDWRRLVDADWKNRYLTRWPCAYVYLM